MKGIILDPTDYFNRKGRQSKIRLLYVDTKKDTETFYVSHEGVPFNSRTFDGVLYNHIDLFNAWSGYANMALRPQENFFDNLPHYGPLLSCFVYFVAHTKWTKHSYVFTTDGEQLYATPYQTLEHPEMRQFVSLVREGIAPNDAHKMIML